MVSNLGDLQFATSKDKKLGPKIPRQMRICMSQSFAAVETLEIKLEAQVYNHAENTYVYIYIHPLWLFNIAIDNGPFIDVF